MDPPLNEPPPTFAGLANLSGEKLQVLQNTLSSILASPAAEAVYTQLIDGRPTWQSSLHPPEPRNEVTTNSDQSNPSEWARKLYQTFRGSLKLQLLKVDINVYRFVLVFSRRY